MLIYLFIIHSTRNNRTLQSRTFGQYLIVLFFVASAHIFQDPSTLEPAHAHFRTKQVHLQKTLLLTVIWRYFVAKNMLKTC